MAFHADEYIDVIVEQIAENFTALDKAVKICPDLQKAIEKYRKLQESGEADFFALKDAEDKAAIYQQSIGDLICADYRTVEPLSVGLFGEWGSGKTHLLKLIEYRIDQLQSKPTKKDPDIFMQTTIPIFFNAWRFEKEEHLIIPLFRTMLAQMQEYEHIALSDQAKRYLRHGIAKLKILSKALLKGLKKPDNLGQFVSRIVEHDPSVVTELIDGQKVAQSYREEETKEFAYDTLLKELTEKGRLEDIYYQIPKWIEKIAIFDNISFVFLIDDLDRCLPENTLKMLESIKLFLDIPSCAFVLAIDDDVVERGVAYHYRDYLHQSNHTIVHLDAKQVTNPREQQQELPITGHEYLEKMIQLPFRIPVIDDVDIRQFLEKNYVSLFGKFEKDEAERLLDFFAKTIPAKPRKIKRTAALFGMRLEVFEKLGLPADAMLLAKITLLELFAPRLLRFIQNNGYRRMYDRLVFFRTLQKDEEKEHDSGSLANSEIIHNWIDAYQDEKAKERYRKMMLIVEESYSGRMVFDLDDIFDTSINDDRLKQTIELKGIVVAAENEKEKVSILSPVFLQKLFLEDDPVSWRDAFEDEALFAEGKATLSDQQLEAVIQKAKEQETFGSNPEWVGIVAKYLDKAQYIKMLKELYHLRFAAINDKFAMGIYPVTFAEYDRYCEWEDAKKPGDEGWGRGKRPVINVSWKDADRYARWLSEVLEHSYRLPDENEWYLACNGGENKEWSFGDDKNKLGEYAWYSENSEDKTHPVGEKKPNSFGLHDMHGNVWEWCEDWYDEKEKAKVLRGGSWYDVAVSSRSAFRNRVNPEVRGYSRGFRLLRTLP